MIKNSDDLISKLKHQAKLALEERAKTDALLLSIGEGVIVTDEQGRIIRVNQATIDILACRKSQLIGKWLPETIPAVHEDGSYIHNMDRPIARAILAGTALHERTYYKRKDGVIIPVQVTVSPVFLRGKPAGAIEIFRDITLDLQVDKIKTEFISIASHQLRTPLSAINTYSHLLAEGYGGKINAAQESFLTTILSATTRMNDLINTLLNVTRIEAGNIIVSPKEIQLSKLVAEIVAEFSPQAKERKITLTTSMEENEATVSTDSLLVKEVFSNLLANALKYTPEGGKVSLTLKMKGNKVVFSVSDSGYGIPNAAQQQVFTKFFRASNVLKKEVGGTGLGLYLAKVIAENLDGDIWFRSKEDKGTTFYFSLPTGGSIEKTGKFKLET